MNKILISIVLIISLMGLVTAVDGQNNVVMQQGGATEKNGASQTWIGGNPSSVGAIVSQYSEYYSLQNGLASKTHISAPKKSVTKGQTPITVYFGDQMPAVPYTQYQTYAPYMGKNSLWIEGASSWTKYAMVPQSAILSLIATTTTGGNGYFYEINPDGKLNKNRYYFYPGSNQMDFYADSIGQHLLLFVIDSEVSNVIVIDVVSYYPPYQQPGPSPISSLDSVTQPSTVKPSTTQPATDLSNAGLGRYSLAKDEKNHIVTVTLNDNTKLGAYDLAQQAADKCIRICNILFQDKNVYAVVVIQLADIGGTIKPGITIRMDRSNWYNVRNRDFYDWKEFKTAVNYWYMPPEMLVQLGVS
jgi:hypothetical protein